MALKSPAKIEEAKLLPKSGFLRLKQRFECAPKFALGGIIGMQNFKRFGEHYRARGSGYYLIRSQAFWWDNERNRMARFFTPC